ncbi:tryptophan biosynthesis modulator TrpM [Streptomyces sp. NPDC091292]|uniref:tryptophan biosynthesis modulator TrpM n=1 Tax=Streptomyces sp. NPDC091292 TaxID=3365991 RepID=UPI0037F285D5
MPTPYSSASPWSPARTPGPPSPTSSRRAPTRHSGTAGADPAMPISSRLARGCRPRGCRAPARRVHGRRVRYVIGDEPGQVNGQRWRRRRGTAPAPLHDLRQT